LKPKIDCKNNGKWKLQASFSRNYDFAFTNLWKDTEDVNQPEVLIGFKKVNVSTCKPKQFSIFKKIQKDLETT
jgi:hypothetical protein